MSENVESGWRLMLRSKGERFRWIGGGAEPRPYGVRRF